MKINGWELTFVELIEKIRLKEILALLHINDLRAYNEAIFFVSPILVVRIKSIYCYFSDNSENANKYYYD